MLKFDRDRERVSLGYKQLLPDPWSSVEERFPIGTRVGGRIASVADYGAFVELENGRRSRSCVGNELVENASNIPARLLIRATLLKLRCSALTAKLDVSVSE